ncbi:hypothetical protein [Paraferrimonas haliotis]|uniref:Uncharacterized protein n=1 Tax=Paraferrimonas haliotis TaxID=2013866 RepID=A0AA37TKN0_9GAMM|nr:hypothetical protein [Paraferrimonas haliotis]GLS83242.1 hypothetical protein GCM10007894_12190 [Paraferrimonas haliotis]
MKKLYVVRDCRPHPSLLVFRLHLVLESSPHEAVAKVVGENRWISHSISGEQYDFEVQHGDERPSYWVTG